MSVAPIVRVAPGRGPAASACRLGVPLPRGWCADERTLRAVDAATGESLRLQARALARWPDRSVKWALVDAAMPAAFATAGGAFEIVRGASGSGETAAPTASATARARGVDVHTGAFALSLADAGPVLATAATLHGRPCLGADGLRLAFEADSGRATPVAVERIDIEEQGPVRIVVVQRGTLGAGAPRPLEFVARWSFVAGSSAVELELRIRNPNAAAHPGGCWDLGDAGSTRIADLSVELAPAVPASTLAWRTAPDTEVERCDAGGWSLYQDSSGGERWDSPNHVEADGSRGTTFRGWRLKGASVEAGGLRAQPTLALEGAGGTVAACVRDFWQNFPKALRLRAGALSVGLFPSERGRPTELQGGEQKRHRIAFAFGPDALDAAAALVDPPHAWVDPAWIEASGAVTGAVAGLGDDPGWAGHVSTIVDGPRSFAERREAIDEYGWRHFGDLWADHEAVNHRGDEPFVSHYNNQYDFVLSAGTHALRTGDARWARLARECAEHTVDIDVYHTDADRQVFNGGMFWHTDHYFPARTATHRTYSRANANGGDYGGGPSNEHDYASGLLLHHWRTGDPDALEAVVGLADWVIAMDDGARTLLGLVDPGPTGLASRTLDPDYHGPGRGAGNSIATLLDGYLATGRRAYLAKAEELVLRCIHPQDDIAARRLDDPENRWSYLVFLQVLGERYLPLKHELGETDYAFHHAREGLLHYSDWMLEHELPYADVLHKVELPTESWPAHDIRKCHVMHLAARWDHRGRRDAFRRKARYFRDRCLADLERFPTKHLTRPLVILAAYAHLHAWHERLAPFPQATIDAWRHNHAFGEPVRFLTQRERLPAALRARLAVVAAELRRMLRDRLGRLRRRGGVEARRAA